MENSSGQLYNEPKKIELAHTQQIVAQTLGSGRLREEEIGAHDEEKRHGWTTYNMSKHHFRSARERFRMEHHHKQGSHILEQVE